MKNPLDEEDRHLLAAVDDEPYQGGVVGLELWQLEDHVLQRPPREVGD